MKKLVLEDVEKESEVRSKSVIKASFVSEKEIEKMREIAKKRKNETINNHSSIR
jgi:hypothetical protein